MKILLINYECPPLGGGGGVECYQIAQELAKSHQVDYLTSGHKGLPDYEKKYGINITRVRIFGRKNLATATIFSMVSFFPSALFHGIKMCLSHKYDVINAHFVLPSGLPAVILAKIFKIPLIMTIIGGDIYDPSKKWSPHHYWIFKKLIHWLLKQSTFIIAISQNTKDNAIHYYRVKKNIEVIPLGFVRPTYEIVPKPDDNNIKSEDTILISVGRLVTRKRYDIAIEAVNQLIQKGHLIKYLIAGDGPEEQYLKNLVEEKNIAESVIFLGFITEQKKYQYLSNSDIYILSSLHEGFGICLLEAMHCGLPIVATNNGGQTDFLTDGKNVLFVSPHDASGLCEAIEKLLIHDTFRKEMAEFNKKDIQNYYIEKIVNKYEYIFKKSLNN